MNEAEVELLKQIRDGIELMNGHLEDVLAMLHTQHAVFMQRVAEAEKA